MIRNNLFISNFKRILSVIICIVLIGLIVERLNYMLVTDYVWERILWHNFYAEEENIDNLIVGSSHAHMGVNPFILDELNGKNNFCLSTTAMRMNTCYYSIVEAIKDHNIENIYLEVFYGVIAGSQNDLNGVDSLQVNWKNANYMRPSLNKLKFQLSVARSKSLYLETFLPFVRYRSNLFEMGHITNRITEKSTVDYQNYVYQVEDGNGVMEFQDKGYMYDSRYLEEYELIIVEDTYLKSDEMIDEKVEEYLYKIIELCKKEGIRLTFFSTPMYDAQLISSEHYDDYHDYITKIAEENNLTFYDFNLCKETYYDSQNLSYFKDMQHLNASGAEYFTPLFWQVVYETPENNQEYFYSSYSEKLASRPPHVYGFYYAYNDDGNRTVYVASSTEEEMLYRIVLISETGEESLIQDFSENKEFQIGREEHGQIMLEAFPKNEPDRMEKITVSF